MIKIVILLLAILEASCSSEKNKDPRTKSCEELLLEGSSLPTSCDPEIFKSCGDLKHGSTTLVDRFTADSVPLNESCDDVKESHLALCVDGNYKFEKRFSFDAKYSECQVESKLRCGNLVSGETIVRTRYLKERVPFGDTCENVKVQQSATCNDGLLDFDGKTSFASCSIEPNPSIRKIVSYIAPDNSGKEKLKEHLNQAQHSILISMYSMSDSEIRKILVSKAKQGTKVFILFNKGQCDSYKLKSCNEIESFGGNIKMFSKTNHQKYAIIDHEALFDKTSTATPVAVSGSGNWSSSAFYKYDDDMVMFYSHADIKEILADFSLLWPNGRPWGIEGNDPIINLESQEATSGKSVFTSANFKYSSRGVGLKDSVKKDKRSGIVQTEIVRYINKAEKSIKVATAHFRLNSIYEALLEARDRGVDVKLVTDMQEFQYRPNRNCIADIDPKNLDECLAEQGIDVRWKTYMTKWDYKGAKQMHLKYIIIDESYVLTGSFNFSITAETANLETMHTLEGQDIIQDYSKNFEKISNYGYDGQKEELSRRALSGEVICDWPSLTLNYKDFSRLRKDLYSVKDIHTLCTKD